MPDVPIAFLFCIEQVRSGRLVLYEADMLGVEFASSYVERFVPFVWRKHELIKIWDRSIVHSKEYFKRYVEPFQ